MRPQALSSKRSGESAISTGAPSASARALETGDAFRFSFLYFGLFCLTGQIFSTLLPGFGLVSLWLIRPTVFWTAAHVFHIKQPLVYMGSGSGDKTFDWVLTFDILTIAALAVVLWSIVDRRRENHTALHKWFRVVMRFALASQMLLYGLVKAVPLQMPFPGLAKLIEPFGNFSPMGVLWNSVGASPAYEIFTGCAELLGGLLLVIPRTTMFGALVCLADTTQVFVLNMTYDVPVKLFSLHLILLSLFLLAPDAPRLVRFFFLNRPVPPSSTPALFSTRRANRIALGLQIGFGLWLVGSHAFGSWLQWHSYGEGRTKPPIYGSGTWNKYRWMERVARHSSLITTGGAG